MNFSKNLLLMVFILTGSQAQAQAEFVLHSAALEEGTTLAEAHVYDGFGCTGDNVSPDLRWSGAPQGTKYYRINLTIFLSPPLRTIMTGQHRDHSSTEFIDTPYRRDTDHWRTGSI